MGEPGRGSTATVGREELSTFFGERAKETKKGYRNVEESPWQMEKRLPEIAYETAFKIERDFLLSHLGWCGLVLCDGERKSIKHLLPTFEAIMLGSEIVI